MPLPPIAREIIAGQRRIDGRDLIFSTTGRSPISGLSKPKRALDAAVAANEPWTIHDLRRTAATHLGELGVRGDVIEAILNHARPGVAGVYNRSALLAERRDALALWARRIEAIVDDRESGPAVDHPLRASYTSRSSSANSVARVLTSVIDGQRSSVLI